MSDYLLCCRFWVKYKSWWSGKPVTVLWISVFYCTRSA